MKEIRPLFTKENFIDVSMTSLQNPISHKIYKAQVLTDNTGGMSFLKEHLNQKLFEKSTFKTAIVGLYPYYKKNQKVDNIGLKVSLYAKNRDYHTTLTEKLDSIISKLKTVYPQAQFLSAVDSKPVLEKDIAYKAGLGWVGKNTCLLNKNHGSLFFIAEILTDLENPKYKAELQTDHCGTCNKCIEACPTNALTPRRLEVEKCISFRNIESKDYTPNVLTKSTHSWFFGCDVCQTVCPWNEKLHGKAEMSKTNDFDGLNENAVKELEDILKTSNKKLMEIYKDSPLSRARGNGLKRNALQIIFENKISEMKNFLIETELNERLEPLKLKVIESL